MSSQSWYKLGWNVGLSTVGYANDRQVCHGQSRFEYLQVLEYGFINWDLQMMKLTKILYQVTFFTAIAVTVAEANRTSLLGSYKSNGYTLDLESGGDYHSCDPQNFCLTIPRGRSSQQGKTWIWKKAGYTYRVTPVGNTLMRGHYTRLSVKIIDSKRKVISDRIFRSQ